MAKKSVDLADEIMAMIPPSMRSRPWWVLVPQQHLPTLKVIADGWFAGKYGTSRKRAADAISAWLKFKKISTIGHQGVIKWLDQLTP